MRKKWIIAFIAIVVIGVLTFYIMNSRTEVNFCISDTGCYLNLCGCKCYTQGFGPKEACGTPCPQEYNITGCKCVDNRCKEISEYSLYCQDDSDCVKEPCCYSCTTKEHADFLKGQYECMDIACTKDFNCTCINNKCVARGRAY